MTDETQQTPAPVIEVVSGSPTTEEVAALVTVIAAASSSGETSTEPSPKQWASHRRIARGALQHGRNAWRTSSRAGF